MKKYFIICVLLAGCNELHAISDKIDRNVTEFDCAGWNSEHYSFVALNVSFNTNTRLIRASQTLEMNNEKEVKAFESFQMILKTDTEILKCSPESKKDFPLYWKSAQKPNTPPEPQSPTGSKKRVYNPKTNRIE